MTVTNNAVLEFDTLDELHDWVKDLKHERVVVRRKGQLAQGAILDIRRDPRFNGFTTYAASATRPGMGTDLTVFTIYRAPPSRRQEFQL